MAVPRAVKELRPLGGAFGVLDREPASARMAAHSRRSAERTLAGKISKNYSCDPAAKVRPDAGSHRPEKVRLAGWPAGSVAPA
jgi:hypothetical protein